MTIVSAPNGMQFKWVCIFQPVSANVEGTIQKQGTIYSSFEMSNLKAMHDFITFYYVLFEWFFLNESELQ